MARSRLAVATVLLAILAMQPAVATTGNERAAQAVSITSIPFATTGDNTRAASARDEVQPSCAQVGATQWFKLTAASDQVLRADTAGSDFDTVLAVYTGSPSSIQMLDFQEVACGDDPGSAAASVTFTAKKGTTYYLQLGGYLVIERTGDPAQPVRRYPRTGTFSLRIGLRNDDLSRAWDVDVLPFVERVSTAGATTEAGEPSSCGAGSKTVWYRHTADEDQTMMASTVGSAFDTILNVYESTSYPLIEFECNDDAANGAVRQSRVVFQARRGVTYTFQVASKGAAGDLVFTLTDAVAPVNDAFAGAAAVSDLPFESQASTLAASLEPGEPVGSCGSGVDATVWYRVDAPSSGVLVASASESDYPAVIAVYEGDTLGALTEAGCVARSRDGGTPSLAVRAVAGRSYFVQAGGAGAASGTLTIGLWTAERLPNDDIGSAQPVATLPLVAALDTTPATSESLEPQQGCASVGATVWYRLDARPTFTLLAETAAGTGFDSVLNLWSGAADGSSLSPVACNDDVGHTVRSKIVVAAPALPPGRFYFVQAGGRDGDNGALTLRIAAVERPENDESNGASLFAVPRAYAQDTTTATASATDVQPSCASGPAGATVWFRYRPLVSGLVTVSTAGSSYDTVLAMTATTDKRFVMGLDRFCSDDVRGTPQSELRLDAVAGATYLFQVAGYRGDSGSLIFTAR